MDFELINFLDNEYIYNNLIKLFIKALNKNSKYIINISYFIENSNLK